MTIPRNPKPTALALLLLLTVTAATACRPKVKVPRATPNYVRPMPRPHPLPGVRTRTNQPARKPSGGGLGSHLVDDGLKKGAQKIIQSVTGQDDDPLRPKPKPWAAPRTRPRPGTIIPIGGGTRTRQ